MWQYEAEFVVSAFMGEQRIPKSGDLSSVSNINVHAEVNPSLASIQSSILMNPDCPRYGAWNWCRNNKGLHILTALLREVRLREPCDL